MALRQDRFHLLGVLKPLHQSGYVIDTTSRAVVQVKGDAFTLKMTGDKEEVDIFILSMVN